MLIKLLILKKHKMRSLVLSILTFILVFTSCMDKDEFSCTLTVLNTTEVSTSNPKENIGMITEVLFPVEDSNHQVIGAYPFRSNWSLGDDTDASIFVKNTSGAKIFHSQSNYFWDYGSSKLNKLNKYKGNHITALRTIETLIKEDFIPYADSLNIKLINQYEIPELVLQHEKHDALYISLPKPKENTIKVIATEWLSDNGIKSIVVIKHHSKVYENETIWGYTRYIMDAPVKVYESAKSSFLNSLSNYKVCYQYILEENKKMSENLSDIAWEQTCPYFTKKERLYAIWKEQERTGSSLYQTMDGYIAHLNSKGFLIDMDPSDICNLTAIYKKEEDTKRYLDSLYFKNPGLISNPPEREYEDYSSWSELEDLYKRFNKYYLNHFKKK